MKKAAISFIMIIYGCCAWAQQTVTYSPFYYQRASLFEILPTSSEDIIFLGNSITNGCEWSELFENPHVKNRGISGDRAKGVYDRLDAVIKGKPAKIFLMIGINDLSKSTKCDTTIYWIEQIIDKVKQETPRTELFLQNILPINETLKKVNFRKEFVESNIIVEANEKLKEAAEKYQITYIDLYSRFKDSDNRLDIQYSNDGLHLTANGYVWWKEIILPYINK